MGFVGGGDRVARNRVFSENTPSQPTKTGKTRFL